MYQAPYTLRVRTAASAPYSPLCDLPKTGQVHLISFAGTGHLSVEGRPFIFLNMPSEIGLGEYGIEQLGSHAATSLRASR
jgi:hypothetical protein